MEYLIEIVLASGCLILFYNWYRRNLQLPPGPWNLPILGYLPWLDLTTPTKTLIQLANKFGPIYGIYMGQVYTVVLSDVKLLLKDAANGLAPLYLNVNIMSNGNSGLAFAEGEVWEEHRKFVANFFRMIASSSSICRDELESKIKDQAVELISNIEDIGNPAVLDPSALIHYHVITIINFLLTGKKVPLKKGRWIELLHVFDQSPQILGVAGSVNYLPMLRILPKYRKMIKTHSECVDTMMTYFKDVTDSQTYGLNLNLITALLEKRQKDKKLSQKYYSDKQCNMVLVDLFGAGGDSTSNTILFFLGYMAAYQNIQECVREELLTESIHYFEATIAEVLRITSVVPMGMPHGILEDMKIGNYRIPKGSMVLCLIEGIHHDVYVWGDPKVFRPERFIDDHGKFHKPEAFIPFQVGKRKCVAEEFAKMIVHTLCAALLLNFKVSSTEALVDLSGQYGLVKRFSPQQLVFTKL